MQRPTLQMVQLEKLRWACRQHFDRCGWYMCRNELELNAMIEERMTSVVIDLTTSFLRGNAKTETETKKCWHAWETGPADWWQHFRLRWFPQWWLGKHPVKMKKEQFEYTTEIKKTTYHLCPHLDIKIDSPHIQFCLRGE